MKEAMFTVLAVVAVSALALGVLVLPTATGQAYLSRYGVFIPDDQFSPGHYGYRVPIERCMFPQPCRVESDSCLSGAMIFVDGFPMGCAVNTFTPWCSRFKIGWNGGQDCHHRDPNTLTQCVCP